MTERKLLPIEQGQWVLTYIEHFYPSYIEGDMKDALERLVTGGSGWTCLRKSADQFNVVQVAHVMPKTFRDTEGNKHWRYLVVASAGTAGEMLALRDKLFTIGFAADRKIEEETARRMTKFKARTRAEALAKIHAALPHIFGGQA